MMASENPTAKAPIRAICRLVLASALALGAGLSGCGGGSTNLAGGGTSGTGISQGSVTAFGSVVVNGVEFSTAGPDTEIRVPGNDQATETDLAVGMVVTVRGDWNPTTGLGTAERITYEDALRGPVSEIQPSAGTFRILGQLVRISANTVFDLGVDAQTPLAALNDGDHVAVSGHFAADGVLRATRVERPAALETVRLRGVVQAVDPESNRFTLAGGQTVDYDNLAEGGPELDPPSDGDTVIAEGTLSGGVLLAEALRLLDAAQPVAEAGAEVELEGLITDGTDWEAFSVSGQPVVTQSPQGRPADSAFATGLRVEVEGRIDNAGRLVAEEVKLRPEGDLELEDIIADIDGDRQFILRTGVPVQTTATTVFDLDEGDRRPAFGALDDGDPVEVDGYWDQAAGTFVATRIELEDEDEGCSLEGLVEEATDNPPGIWMLGVFVEPLDVSNLQGLVGSVVEAESERAEDCVDGMRNAEIDAADDDDDDDD